MPHRPTLYRRSSEGSLLLPHAVVSICESSNVDTEVDHTGVAIGGVGGPKGQARLVVRRQAVVDPVVRVARVATTARAVRALGVYGIRQGIVEKELRGELVGLRRSRVETELEMDVNGASTVPTGVDSGERRDAVRIRYLIAAQESPRQPRHVRVCAGCVTVPHIEIGTGERRAGAIGHARYIERQREWNACSDRTTSRISSNVGAIQLLIDEERPFREGGGENAAGSCSSRASRTGSAAGRRTIRRARRAGSAREENRLRYDNARRTFDREPKQIAAAERRTPR